MGIPYSLKDPNGGINKRVTQYIPAAFPAYKKKDKTKTLYSN